MSSFKAIIDENKMLRNMQGMEALFIPYRINVLLSVDDYERDEPISDRDMLFLIDFVDGIDQENERLKFNDPNDVGIVLEEEKITEKNIAVLRKLSDVEIGDLTLNTPPRLGFSDIYQSQSFHTGSNSSKSPGRKDSQSSFRD